MTKGHKKTKLMGVQQNLLKLNVEQEAILRYLLEQSGKLYNTGVYFVRQTLFKTGVLLTGKYDLNYEPTVAKSLLAKSLPSTPAQQTLLSVMEAFKSFARLLKAFKNQETPHKPKVPGYLKGAKLFKVAFPNSGGQKPQFKQGVLHFSLGRSVRRWFGIKSLEIPMPSNLELKKIKEFTFIQKNGSFYLECSYEIEKEKHDLYFNKALSLDLGTSANLAALVDTEGGSLLFDANQLKAINQLWNKKVSTRKENKPQGYWDPWLDRVTQKRNHQIKDIINKTAKQIVDYALKRKIGVIVCGWNQGFKTYSHIGRVNNQNFIQIPLAQLRNRIQQLCEISGIMFEVTEEAYTSKASFLDGDTLPKFGEKPDGWRASGNRVKRGLYRTKEGFFVNADLNGAANILRKVSTKLGLNLSQVGRRCLTTVARVNVV